MTRIRPEIVQQVEELERLRAAGHVTDEWYRRGRAHIVRRHREAQAAQRRAEVSEVSRTTIDLQRPA
jgi:cytochrome c-type biogenesis protein CcmH/NrfG